ncbi:MAG: MarR family transcriptional regulator [Halobacteriovoraceae bacterium]|nr:MarR family transcriptional regulator [Halobacteriovoraceae bacterium]
MSNKIINSPIERTTRKLFSMVIERLAVVISKESLSFSQVAALHIIDREGFININDISNKLNLSVSATSRMIDELVKKEFVERKEDPKNRRVKILSLSPNGENFMNNLSIERVKIIRQSANLIAEKVKLKIIKNSKGEKK